MKVSKEDRKKSEELTDALAAAAAVDNGKQIKDLDEQILEKHFAHQKQLVLEYHNEAFQLKCEKDLLLCAKRNLISDRLRGIERAEDAMEKFHRPFRLEFVEEVGNIYGKAERQKRYIIIDTTRSNLMLPIHKVRSNILDVLLLLKEISFDRDYFQTTHDSLSIQTDRLEKLQNSLATEFREKTIGILGDTELETFRMLFQNERYADPTWKPVTLSQETLAIQIRLVFDLMKEKVLNVA